MKTIGRLEQISIEKIRIDIRDDIKLRTYVLIKKARHIWLLFSRGLREYGLNPKAYEDFLDLYQDICINGMKVPIVVQQINNEYYLEDGAHRLSIARALGMSTISADVVNDFGKPSAFIAQPKTVNTPFPIDENNPRIFKMFKYIPPTDIEKICSLEKE
jgi:hypothetical protein